MMVLVTQRTYLIPRIQSMNVAAVMVLLNELPNAPGNYFYRTSSVYFSNSKLFSGMFSFQSIPSQNNITRFTTNTSSSAYTIPSLRQEYIVRDSGV